MTPPPAVAKTEDVGPLLETISWAVLGVAFACAAVIVHDVFGRGHRQRMSIMNAVYPVTALYWGPAALWFYFRFGRRMSVKEREEGGGNGDRGGGHGGEGPARWWQIAKGDSHCGAGCTLGDIGGEWLVFLTAWTIPLLGVHAADQLTAMYAADFALAWTFGIAFQYFSIVPMRDVGRVAGLWQAIKADTLSIVAFQVGLFAYMALYHLVLFQPPIEADTAAYWFMMQIGMVAGFFTAYPVNRWLIARGIKEKM